MASESPQVRRRPTKAKMGHSQRDSNLVRASVLETALELGVGQNSTVANWIFNNPLSEEVEDLPAEPDYHVKLDTTSEPSPYLPDEVTPTLTSASNSTSDESSSLNSPGNITPIPAAIPIHVHLHKPSVTEAPHVHFGDFPSDQLQLFSPFALSLHDKHHAGTRGNTVGKLPKDSERSRSQDDRLRPSTSPGPPDSGYASEGQYLSSEKGGGGKDKSKKPKANKGTKSKTADLETDRDYASDGGYLSASSNKSQGKSPNKVKSRAMSFFRRRSKKVARGSDDEDEDSVPPVPAIPILPRPSSPKPLERRTPAPSSPARSGFSPLTLNLTNPPASPPKRRVTKSPPPIHARAASPQRLDLSVPQGPVSPPPPASSISTAATAAPSFPLPPSTPSTPQSTTSLPTTPSSTQHAAGAPKALTTSSSRQHIPPPGPPPTLPLPQPPPSPSISSSGTPLPSPTNALSRTSLRSISAFPPTPGSTRPLTPRSAASPLRPFLSPRASSGNVPSARLSEFPHVLEGDQPNGNEAFGRQRPGTAIPAGSTPAFLQRRIQHGPPPSPRHPPPDLPLPPSPCPTPNIRPRTPIGPPSKFHEHFSSVSSAPLTQVLSPPMSMSASPSTVALSESSSGPSVRSSHISSSSGLSEEPAVRDSANMAEYSRPTTSASILSESSYGHPIPSTFGRPLVDLKSRFSDRSDVSSSVSSSKMHRESSGVTAFDDDDADIDNAAPKSYVDEDDDASVYTSDDKTAGRRTMYLVEHGELDENGDEIVVAGSNYWGPYEVPPPLPSLPPMLARPGPGYF